MVRDVSAEALCETVHKAAESLPAQGSSVGVTTTLGGVAGADGGVQPDLSYVMLSFLIR